MVEKSRRFLRTEALLGEAGMQKLQRAEVMIIGLGAVGGYCVSPGQSRYRPFDAGRF